MAYEDLIRETDQLELYGRKPQIQAALLAGKTEVAARLCQEAIREAHYRARYACAPIGPEGHVRQAQSIRGLWKKLRQQSDKPL